MTASPTGLTEAQVWEVAFKALGATGAALAALGAIIAFFLTRYWNIRDRAASANQAARDKEREILYESLKWFEGGTQTRSIGIAVVSTSWAKYPEFRDLWTEVLANQAIYLLTDSKQGDKAHERENLRRILELLSQEQSHLTKETRAILLDTISRKTRSELPRGLELTSELLDILDAARPKLEPI